MKFARHLAEEGSEPELHSLYKQLKKSLRIFEGPADAGSVVDVPRTLPSSDDEAEEPHAVAPAGAAAAEPAGASGAAQPSAQQRGGAPAEQQAPGQQQQRQPPAEHEAQFVALVEQCVQQVGAAGLPLLGPATLRRRLPAPCSPSARRGALLHAAGSGRAAHSCLLVFGLPALLPHS